MRGQPLHLGLGGDHRDPDRPRRSRRCGRRSAATRTESASLGSTTTSAAPQAVIASSSWPVDGRRPGPPVTTTAPASANSAARPGPAATATIRRPVALGGALAAPGLGDLLGEVGDPDPVRPPGVDAGLDRGADVVDVDVDVPQPVAADDDERVAERARARRAARGSRRPRRRGGTSPRTPGRPRSGRPPAGAGVRDRDVRAARAADGHRHRAAAGEHGLGGVEDHADAPAAGVDDAGVARAPGAARACGPAPRGRPAAAVVNTSRAAHRAVGRERPRPPPRRPGPR